MAVDLYKGCFVKTRGGMIHGPLGEHREGLFEGDDKGEVIWYRGGRYFYAHDHDKDDPADVIAVYANLSEAASSNPEL